MLLPAWHRERWAQEKTTFSPLLLLLLASLQGVGSVLEEIIFKRNDYYDNCNKTLTENTFPGTGIYCKGTFDKFVCWPHSAPGNVSVPCPSYLPWITENDSRSVYSECLSNGSWRNHNNFTGAWRDQTECNEPEYFKNEEEEVFRQSALRLISIIGYSLSFITLLLASLLMGILRKLHCTRNYIHMNLFVSFMLRAMAVFTKEMVFYVMYTKLPSKDPGWNSYSVIAVVCKASRVSMEYFVACNYFWLLVEAIFLHTLLFTAVLTNRRLLKTYMFIGWGTPVLFVLAWTVTKVMYENKECWANNNRWIWWIIRGPINVSVLVIFFIFIKILKLLLSKLKADQVRFTDYRYSLARATLVLIPLLGIHEVVFTFLIDECVQGSSRYAKNFINLTLSSFQGFMVSVLYCFANGEVQTEVKKRWQLFQFTNHFQVTPCIDIQGVPLKHLWKCSRDRRPHGSQQSISDEEGVGLPTESHLLQVTLNGDEEEQTGKQGGAGQTERGRDTVALQFHTRKSLSSSDGEMTLGETLEEILEENEF